MDIFLNLLSTVQNIGYWGYVVAFLFAFMESVALIGGFIPGSTAIILLGFMTANGYLSPVWLCVYVVAGAVLGDSLSYWLGTKGTHFFKDENKILKASHLEMGKAFFNKHGDKSIFLGRFVGIIRAMIPFAAGLAKMNKGKFIFWNVFSGLVWGISHVYLGYFFGGALKAIEAVSKRLSIFILLLVIVFIVIWFMVKLSKPVFSFLHTKFKGLISFLISTKIGRRVVEDYPGASDFVAGRFVRKDFYGWTLTVLMTTVSLFVLFFALVADGVLDNQTLVSLDQRVSGFLYYFRDPAIITVSFWLSLFGNIYIVVFTSLVFITLLLYWKKRNYVLPFVFSIVSSSVMIGAIKLIVDRPRPGGVLPAYREAMASFPSGHSAIAIALYGYIFYIISRYLLRKNRNYQFVFWTFLLTVFVFLMGFCRVYLGVHYFSDVLGGYLLGGLALTIAIALTEWNDVKKSFWNKILGDSIDKTKIKWSSVIGFTTVIIFYVCFGLFFYKPEIISPKNIDTIFRVRDQKVYDILAEKGMANFSESLTGREVVPINFSFWASEEEDIQKLFSGFGWLPSDDPSVLTLFKLAKSTAFGVNYDTVTILPYFWNQLPNDYAFEKNISLIKSQKQREQIRIWKTSLSNKDDKKLFVGSVVVSVRSRWSPVYKILRLRNEEGKSMCEMIGHISASTTASLTSSERYVFSETDGVCEVVFR